MALKGLVEEDTDKERLGQVAMEDMTLGQKRGGKRRQQLSWRSASVFIDRHLEAQAMSSGKVSVGSDKDE